MRLGGPLDGDRTPDRGERRHRPPVTIQYWNGFTGGDGPYMRAMVDEFNETHQNITVESNTLGWTDFYQRIVAAVHAGQGPTSPPCSWTTWRRRRPAP